MRLSIEVSVVGGFGGSVALVGLCLWGTRDLKYQPSAAALAMIIVSLHWKGDQIPNLTITNAPSHLN